MTFVQTLLLKSWNGDVPGRFTLRLKNYSRRLLAAQMRDRAALGIREIECHSSWLAPEEINDLARRFD